MIREFRIWDTGAVTPIIDGIPCCTPEGAERFIVVPFGPIKELRNALRDLVRPIHQVRADINLCVRKYIRAMIAYMRQERALGAYDVVHALLSAPFGAARRKAAFEAVFGRPLAGVKTRYVGIGWSATSVDRALRRELRRLERKAKAIKPDQLI